MAISTIHGIHQKNLQVVSCDKKVSLSLYLDVENGQTLDSAHYVCIAHVII